MSILITGATGFLGIALTKTLTQQSISQQEPTFIAFNRDNNASALTHNMYCAVIHLTA